MNWKRARRPEQIAVRRNSILQAAHSLFREKEYEKISLNEIARVAGINKANVYRYFSSKEEIFLAKFESEFNSFARSLIKNLSDLRAKSSAKRVCQIWLDTTLERPALLDLMPQLSLSLEKNSSVEKIVQFKRGLHEQMSDVVCEFVRVYPGLSVEQWGEVFEHAGSMMSGLWPQSNPGDSVVEAMTRLDLQPWEFRPRMERVLLMLIQGIQANNKE